MEVVYDLDVEVAGLCDELGINMVRAGVVANHPALRAHDPRNWVIERLDPARTAANVGVRCPWPDPVPRRLLPACLADGDSSAGNVLMSQALRSISESAY